MKEEDQETEEERGLKGAVNRGYRHFWARRGVDPKYAWKLEERMNAKLLGDSEFDLDDDES